MFENIKAVLFDLDGTLVDSMWLWKTIDIEYLKKFGLDFPDDFQDEIEGMSFTETAEFFKKRFNLPVEVEDIKEDWNKMAGEYYLNKVPLKSYVKVFLEYLYDNNYKTGIGTSNSRELVTMIIEKYDLNDYFDTIRTSCEVNKGKPHPDIYLQVARDLNVKPEECLVFEDVPAGIIAAKRAGMKVCAVYDDFSKELKEEIKQMSDYYIDSYKEIMNFIEGKRKNGIFAN